MLCQNFIKGAAGHFKTVTKHKAKVFQHCVKCGIAVQGLTHDLSKFSPTEFIYSAEYFQGNRSPNEKEREIYGFSHAWIHHKGRNPHHFEYWTDYDPVTRTIKPVKMPKKYVAEMFCDRVAASKIYLGENYTDSSPLEYFMRSKKTRIIHPDTSDTLEKLLIMLAKKGEDYTFNFIKKNLKS